MQVLVCAVCVVCVLWLQGAALSSAREQEDNKLLTGEARASLVLHLCFTQVFPHGEFHFYKRKHLEDTNLYV